MITSQQRTIEERTTAGIILRGWVVVVDLNLDAALGGELGDDDLVGNLLEECRVALSPKTVVEGVEIRSSDDVIQVRALEKKRYNLLHHMTDRLTSLESNVSASGARFGPLQNGWPELVTASLGKL